MATAGPDEVAELDATTQLPESLAATAIAAPSSGTLAALPQELIDEVS